MKALVYTGAREMAYRDEPAPHAALGEVLLDIDAVGICGSDMHAYLGQDPRRVPPVILGHEAAGTVVEGPHAGERAVLNPLIACGICDECLGGRSNLCHARNLIGLHRAGAFAERVSVPERNLVPIPPDMDACHAALTEPAATSLHAVRLAARASHRPLCEAHALVIGAGSVGLFAALCLADHGAARIDLAETNALRRASAERTGVVHGFDPLATPPESSAYELIVDAVGGRASREIASDAVRPGGIIVHIGLLDNDGGLDLRRMTLHEITCIATYTYTPVDLRATVEKLYSGALGDLAWIEQRPLSEGPVAFDDLLNGRTAAAKIVLRP